jgi:hypothetical protein
MGRSRRRRHWRHRLHRGSGTRTIEDLRARHIRFVISNALTPVRKQLDRYGISDALGPDAYYGTADEALEAFHGTEATSSD